MLQQLHEIPPGWIQTRLKDICTNIQNIDPRKYPNKEFTYVDISAIDNSINCITKEKKILGKNAPSRARQKIVQRDILFSTVRTYLKNIAMVDKNYTNAVCSTGFCVIRPSLPMESHYVFQYLLTDDFINRITPIQTGTLFPAVRESDILEQTILLPPIEEQKRIVSKIEDLSKESRIVHQTLDEIPGILKKFRRSVLASAFRGELISQDYGDEHAGKLLEKIRNERRQKWEEDIKIKGKNPKNFKYKEPEHVSQEEIEIIPHGWVWATLDEISEKIVDGTHFTPKYASDGIPFISVKDVRNETIYFDDCKYISKHDHKDLIKRCNPEFGDILITKSGTIGRIAVVKTQKEFSLFVSVALIKPLKKYVDSDFVALMLENYINNIDIEQAITGGVIKNFHIEDLKKVKIPLTTLEEQKRICKKFKEQLSLVHLVEKSIEEAKKRADRIDQAILAKAFRGELVPQDPKDEPASVLLERIKSEREKQLEVKQTSTNKPRKSR